MLGARAHTHRKRDNDAPAYCTVQKGEKASTVEATNKHAWEYRVSNQMHYTLILQTAICNLEREISPGTVIMKTSKHESSSLCFDFQRQHWSLVRFAAPVRFELSSLSQFSVYSFIHFSACGKFAVSGQAACLLVINLSACRIWAPRVIWIRCCR